MKKETEILFSMPKGFLGMEVLTLLKKPMCGYDIIKYIEEHFRCWKPSPGSVYPMLKKMERDGLVKKKKEGRKNSYLITEKGMENLEEFRKIREEIQDKFMAMIRLLGDQSGSEIMKNFIRARRLMREIDKDPSKKGRLNKLIVQFVKNLKKLAEE